MTANLRDAIPLAGGEWLVSFVTRTPPGEWFDGLKDKPVTIEVKRESRKRSLDANAMCWALCADIGKAMTPPVSKEDIYRQAIKAVGVYTPVVVVIWDIETIRRRWEEHGTGWFVEIADDAGTGRKMIHLYYGSSTYTVDEMRVLLDWLVDQAEQMEIKIPLSKADEEKLLERWGTK
jgi:hypothetical protein